MSNPPDSGGSGVGDDDGDMIFVILLVMVPFSLLGLMLAMERVERPLRADALGDQVASALATARAEDVEELVGERVRAPVSSYGRYRARHRPRRAGLLRRPAATELARR